MRSARSCMLVMPKPVLAPLLGDAAPVVGDRQPEADRAHAFGVRRVMRRARRGGRRWSALPARCRGSRGRRRRRAAAGRDRQLDRDVGAAAREIGHALERGGDVLDLFGCGRSAQTERRASTMCVRARSTAVSMLRATAGGSDAGGSLRRPAAASGWRRSPAPACRGCRGRGGCAPRAPPAAALRSGSVRRAGFGAAPASPAAPSRRASARCQAPSQLGTRPRRQREPAEVARRQHERRDQHRVDAVRRR